jgi:hypothetical protein
MMAAALDIQIYWLSEFATPIFPFLPSSSKTVHFPFKKRFCQLCRHRGNVEKVVCHFHKVLHL